MRDLEETQWVLKGSINIAGIRESLASGFAVKVNNTNVIRITLCDDYDWDLWRAGIVCVRKGTEQYELHVAKRACLQCYANKTAKFWWEFPEGECRDLLKKHIDLRAVVSQFELDLTVTPLELLNEDEKIVARVIWMHDKASDDDNDEGKERNYFTLKPLRGYLKEYKQLSTLMNSRLNARPMPVLSKLPLLANIFVDAGVTPAEPPSKNFGLKTSDAAEGAVRKMAAAMVERASQQVKGILNDTDTEFLHDYRVNLRKTRSLLTLTRDTLDFDKYVELKKSLSSLASATNHMRDLDVFILSSDSYYNLLPKTYHQGVSDLFKCISQDRLSAYKKVCGFIKSKVFSLNMQKLLDELACPPDFQTQSSKIPVIELARSKILLRYKKICRLGEKIHDDTPDENVHEVRIECKKLRYLMELFSELFPRDNLKLLVKHLKNMQNILGFFNDYSIQKEFLQAYTDNNKYSTEIVAAVNGLIATLHQKQLAERRKVQGALEKFMDRSVMAEFQILCRS